MGARSPTPSLVGIGKRINNSKDIGKSHFSTSTCKRTDGVYADLTAMKTKVPFIEAWREKEREKSSVKGQKVVSRMAEPPGTKRMKDSFHKVVSGFLGFLLVFCS